MYVYCREKLENEQDANGKLRKERDGLLKKSNELESEVEELKNYNDQLGIKHQKAISEHAETVRNLKVGLETSAILKLALIGVVYFFRSMRKLYHSAIVNSSQNRKFVTIERLSSYKVE